MLNYRKKIIFSNLCLFLVFMVFLFPFTKRTVQSVIFSSMEKRAIFLIEKMKNRPFSQEEETPYVNDDENFTSLSIPLLESQGQSILKVGFPKAEVENLTLQIEIGLLCIGIFVLLLYSAITWVIVHRMSRPIQQIVNAILPYREGREEHLPRIVLPQPIQSDEFNKLAYTLNSLSEKNKKQFENLVRQRKETEDILESLGEGVIAFDTSAKVTFANQVSCQMLGIDHQTLMGKMLSEVKLSSSAKEELAKKSHEMVLQALQTSEKIGQTWVTSEGEKTFLDLISAPQAHQSGAILVLQDKTSDHKVVEMGKDFIANASHELRTPITIIRGFAETLQDIPDLNREMLHDITEKIVRTCGRLDKLVKSLLNLSDIEKFSEGRFQNCDLGAISRQCRDVLLSVHPEVKIQIEQNLEYPVVKADADLLDLAIMNLLENSVKYSPFPAYICLKIEKGKEQTVSLTVKDQGIGIPEKDLPHIFDRFYTVDKARSRKSGGAGLGLSIVKTIVEKHRGGISVASHLGEGSAFHIHLPIAGLG